MKLTIDDVRSRFIEHFDGTTGSVCLYQFRIHAFFLSNPSSLCKMLVLS